MKKYIFLALCVVLTAAALYFAFNAVSGRQTIADYLLCLFASCGSVATSSLYQEEKKHSV